MEDRGLSYAFRSTDGRWYFHLPPLAEAVLGREGHGADVQFPFIELARQHLRLLNLDGTCWIERLGARGDIRVNGRSIVGAGLVRLVQGDRIDLLGYLSFMVETGAEHPDHDASP